MELACLSARRSMHACVRVRHSLAQLILAELDAPPTLQEEPRLRERSFGRWEGLLWSQIRSDFPEDVGRSNQDANFAVAGGGESRQATLERAHDFMQDLAARHPSSERVLVVTHSGTAACLIKGVLGLRQEQPRSFTVLNCALNEMMHDDEHGWMLRTLGDCAHLEQS